MYEFTSRVGYSEIDPAAQMKLSSLAARMQDCAVFHSDAIGRGPADWFREESGWLVLNWRIEIYRYPRFAEAVTTRTWAYSFRGVRGGRNFTMKNEEGELLAAADSLWIYFDRKTQKPMRVPLEESEGYGVEDPLPGFERAPRKIVLPEGEWTRHGAYEVSPIQIDTNRHLNNLHYIEMAASVLPEDFEVREMCVEYARQVKLGEMLIPRSLTQDEACFVLLETPEGELCAALRFRR